MNNHSGTPQESRQIAPELRRTDPISLEALRSFLYAIDKSTYEAQVVAARVQNQYAQAPAPDMYQSGAAIGPRVTTGVDPYAQEASQYTLAA